MKISKPIQINPFAVIAGLSLFFLLSFSLFISYQSLQEAETVEEDLRRLTLLHETGFRLQTITFRTIQNKAANSIEDNLRLERDLRVLIENNAVSDYPGIAALKTIYNSLGALASQAATSGKPLPEIMENVLASENLALTEKVETLIHEAKNRFFISIATLGVFCFAALFLFFFHLTQPSAPPGSIEKQTQYGEDTAELIHEIRNAFSGIQMAVSNLCDDVESSEEKERLGLVDDELRRISTLLKTYHKATKPPTN